MGYPGQTARCATRSELDPAYDSPVTNSQTRCHPTHIPVETAMLRVDFGVAPGFEFPFLTFSLFANTRFGFKLGPRQFPAVRRGLSKRSVCDPITSSQSHLLGHTE